tara:strand:+ start:1113 stop:1559 length:447 start_codon:yes stop_codon:yes gene_type:complete
LNQQAHLNELDNIQGIVCDGASFAKNLKIEKCDYILAIGFLQYLTSDDELNTFAECCRKMLSSGGSLILKHPLSCVGTFLLDYYREDMHTRYISKYYDLNDLMRPFLGDFELISLERTFTESNIGLSVLDKIEVDERARQMWIHLVKR